MTVSAPPPTDGSPPELDLDEATGRLVRTIDRLEDEQWAAPSLLPGWSRAHVVAHLTLNAEALAGALDGVARHESVPMYPSQAARDRDIERLAAAAPVDLRERMLASTTRFLQAANEVLEGRWATRIERTPGGRTFAAGAVPEMRLREVEIHHVDLDAGYQPSDWPPEFAALLIESMVRRLPGGEAFVVHAVDLDRSWSVGEGPDGPRVTGPAADLAWWLTGRDAGPGLGVSGGPLPRVEPW